VDVATARPARVRAMAELWSIRRVRAGVDGPLPFRRLTGGAADETVRIEGPAGAATALDLLSGELFPAPAPAGADPAAAGTFSVGMPAGAERILLFLPGRPGSILVQAEVTRGRPEPDALRITATLLDAAGNTMPGAHLPVRVTVLPPDADAGDGDEAAPRAVLDRAVLGGVLRCELPLALNDPAGAYTVRVEAPFPEVGGVAQAVYRKDAREFGRLVREHATQEISDKRIVTRFGRVFEAPLVVVHRAEQIPLAATLRAAYAQRGITAEIRFANEVLPRRMDLPFGPGGAPLEPRGPGTQVDRDLIVLDIAAANPLVQEAANAWALTLYGVDADRPGAGRGWIQYAWRAFSTDHDAILVTGGDAAGLATAVKELARILRTR
ncbi:MAG: hypothetical protein ACOCX4_10510, partial [Planctomycetota bacterium]